MAHFMVDDQITFHPKMVAAGNAAVGVWARAGAWAKAHATGGFVSAEVAHALGKKDARKLVTVGLWVEAEHPVLGQGYRFHDWEDTAGNGSEAEEKARREEQREKWRKRKREQRERDRHGVTPGVTSPVTPGSPSPSPSPIGPNGPTDHGDSPAQVLESDARELEDDLISEFVALGFTSSSARARVIVAVRKVVPGASEAEVVDVARGILTESGEVMRDVRFPVAYIEKACRESPGEVRGIWERSPKPRGVAA